MSGAEVPELVDRIYASVLDTQAWPQVLSAVAHAVGGVGAVFIPLASFGATRLIASPEMEAATADYENGWWRYDRRVQVGIDTNLRNGVVTDHDILTDAEIDRDVFYNEFLKPHGLRHFLAHISVPVPGRVTSLSVQRDVRKGVFEEDAAARLAILGGHASRALALATKLAQRDQRETGLTAVVDRIDVGIVLLDHLGRIVFLNRSAERLLGAGVAVRNRRLCGETSAAQLDLDRLVASVLPGSGRLPAAAVALPRAGGALPLLVQALPLEPRTAEFFDHLALGSGGAILTIHDLSTDRGGSIEAQLVRLGLTPGQARVAALVGDGMSPQRAADRLGIKDDSARQVLKTVYARLGISRQSQLALIAARLKVFQAEPGKGR